MNRLFLVLAAVILLTSACADKSSKPSAVANETGMPVMISPTDMKWADLPQRKGMQMAVLTGDPMNREYTQMRKVPAGTDNPLHSHSNELKNVIISGVWYTGKDEASARDFGPGSVIVMPGNWVHVSGCRPGSDCVGRGIPWV